MNIQEIKVFKLENHYLINHVLLNNDLSINKLEKNKDNYFDELNQYDLRETISFLKNTKYNLFQTNKNKTLIGIIFEKISFFLHSLNKDEEFEEIIDLLGSDAITKEFCYPTTKFSISSLTPRVNLFKYFFKKIKINYEIYDTPGYIHFFKRNTELFSTIKKLMNYDPNIMIFFKEKLGENTSSWRIFFSSYIMNSLYCKSKQLNLDEISESINLINNAGFIFLSELTCKQLKPKIELIHLQTKESTNLILLLLNKNIIKLEMLSENNNNEESFFEKIFFKKLYVWENIVKHDIIKKDENFDNFIGMMDEMKLFIDSGVKPLFIKKNKQEINNTLDEIFYDFKMDNNDCLLLKSKKIKNKLNDLLNKADFYR